jgi:hypothetical protein
LNLFRIRLKAIALMMVIGAFQACSGVSALATTAQSKTISPTASPQLAVAGFEIGQEMKSCPAPSVPIRKDAKDNGIACRFPQKTAAVFGTVPNQVSLATDRLQKVESVMASGIDAVPVVARATMDYGSPDETETRERVTYWGWLRGDTRLVVFHHPADQTRSWLILDRHPQGAFRR